MTDQAIAVTKPGFEALSETDIDNFIFHSKYDSLKYYASGYGQIVGEVDGVGHKDYTIRIRHNLGYYPFFEVYVKRDVDDSYAPSAKIASVGTGHSTAYATTTDLFLYFHFYNASLGSTIYETIDFVYKIFLNNLDL